MKTLLPKQTIFFDLLKDMSQHQIQAAQLFSEFVKDYSDFESYCQKAREIENSADNTAHELIDKLNKTFVTPLDREDLYNLVYKLDDSVDLIESTMYRFLLYQIQEKHEAVEAFAAVILEASKYTDQLVSLLPAQKNTKEIKDLVIKLHEMEDEGDVIYERSISDIFKNQKDPISIIKWKDIIENLEYVTDKYQEISDTAEGILVKAS